MQELTERNIELADDATIAQCKRMSGIEKVRATFRLNDLVRRTMVSGIRRQHPQLSNEQLVAELRRRSWLVDIK